MYSWTKRQKPQAELLHDSRYMQETPDQHHLPRTFSRTSQLLGDTPGNVTDWGFKLLGDLGLKTMWELVVSMSIISAPWSSQSQTKGYQPCGTRVASWNESNLRWLQGKRRCFPFPIVRYPGKDGTKLSPFTKHPRHSSRMSSRGDAACRDGDISLPPLGVLGLRDSGDEDLRKRCCFGAIGHVMR